MIKIAIIECDTIEELAMAFDKLNSDDKFSFRRETNIPGTDNKNLPEKIKVNMHGEVDGRVFEELMRIKGYKVRTYKAKKKSCEKFGIRAVIRSGQRRYNLEDIMEKVELRHAAANTPKKQEISSARTSKDGE